MKDVYFSGWGLASSLGPNLQLALQNLHAAPGPQQRAIVGLDQSFPYYAIAQTAEPWKQRCARLLRAVVAQAGGLPRHGALYLASSSLNAGAMEKGESHSENIPDFLAQLAAIIDWQGPVFWINTACTSSLNALRMARAALANGTIDEAIIIGLELENQLSIAGFAGMQLLSQQGSRPFSAGRDGLVLGEAVAALRLSTQPQRWRLAGGAHMIDSSQASGASSTAYRAMLEQTLDDAGLHPADIGLIKVQAAGSIPNDAVEAHALVDFFEQQAIPLPALLSLKPLLGHTLGASGAAEIALLLELLARREWPAQAQNCDPSLKLTLAAAAPKNLKAMLACILGFGGSHACIAIADTLADTFVKTQR